MSTRPKIRTRKDVKAQARVLDGTPSRVAKSATADDEGGQPTPGETVGELWLYGLVGGYWRGFNAESVANALRSMDVDVLVVRIHSPGGYASDGIAISNLLRNLDAHVVVVVDGLAASAASVIALAGDEIIMCPGSQMMIHDASTYGYGNAAELRKAADWIDGQSENYAGVYAYKAGGTVAKWRSVMVAETWYTAEQAVAAGLADVVGTRVAVGSPPVDPSEDDDFDDDETWARAVHDLELIEQCVHPAARAAWRGEPLKPPTASPRAGNPNTEGGSAMAFSPEQLTTLRDTLQLPADADESAIVAAVEAVVEENIEERPAASATTAVPEGHVVIPAAQLADLTHGAEAGARAAATLHERDREAFLDSVKNKYAAGNRASWAQEYDRNPQGTREHFAQAPVLIPDTEVGHNTESADATAKGSDLAAIVESDDYKNGWGINR